MGLTVCVLGSGSSGNAVFISTSAGAFLVDAGFSAREIERRLSEIGVDAADLDGICLSHEHQDHSAGIAVLHRRHGIPLYVNAGTRDALVSRKKNRDLSWQVFTNGASFRIGDMTIEPFSVPHDAYDPVGYIVRHRDTRIGLVTDIGIATTLVRERLRDCHALVLESNHDEELVQEADRPWYIKQRVLSRQGHLSNRAAAGVLAEVAGPQLEQVFLVHLSEDCNRKDLAFQTSRRTLDATGYAEVEITVSLPDQVSPVWTRRGEAAPGVESAPAREAAPPAAPAARDLPEAIAEPELEAGPKPVAGPTATHVDFPGLWTE